MPRRGLGLGVTRCRGGGGDAPDPGPEYLLRDEFTTDRAAPLPSPRTCEPGPGTLTLTQTAAQFSTTGGRLQVSNPTGDGSGHRGVGPGSARAAGRAALARFSFSANSVSTSPSFCWSATPTPTVADLFGAAVVGSALNAVNVIPGGTPLYPLSPGADYEAATVLRGAGYFVLVRDGGWKLVWVHNAGSDATAYAVVMGRNGSPGTLDSFRVADLGAPWDTDHGIASQRLAGAVLAGTDFAHQADALVEWTQTLLPGVTSANTAVSFRRQDADNRWSAEVTPSGSLVLNEVVGGGVTQRAIASGIVAAGHRVVIVFDGLVIRGYSNNALRWTYSSAANFASLTAGRVASLGTGGAISDVISWPRSVESLMPAV